MEQKTKMSDADFLRLSAFIHDKCGIKMDLSKKTLLEGRLSKRLRILGFHTYTEYSKFIFSAEGQSKELILMINEVTTNKTDFIREPWHFEFLINKAIPKLIDDNDAGMGKTFLVWSAGCSSGEEPYTLAMFLKEFALKKSGFRFGILATDISTKVLEKARLGIYKEELLAPVNQMLKKKYILISKDKSKRLARISPELRALVRFKRLNFLDSDYGINEKFEAIFCRNVLIYFDKPTQEKILYNFCNHMNYGSYLFIGHSETIGKEFDLPLTSVAPTVYMKTKQ